MRRHINVYVDRCDSCPFCQYSGYYCGYICKQEKTHSRTIKFDGEHWSSIPDWCPLPYEVLT